TPANRRPQTMLARVLGILRSESEASALGQLEGIRVTIEGTSIETRTDAAGLFALRGNFAGPVGMLFEPPDGGSSARLVITVPRGGELTVTNVHVDVRRGQATADGQHVRFGGLVGSTNCSQQAATMVSRETPNDGNTYTVLMGSASVRDPAGNPLGCANLASGESVDVEGEVGDDGQVDARSVEVEDGSGEDHGGGTGSREGGGDGGDAASGEDGGGGSGEGGTSGEGSHTSGGDGETSEDGDRSGPD
ncbi:MAG TPA: hypothetical protein VLF14_09830, partial [Candidatus Binatia bacterium]|nr:hypothetical protein [Candidatus Binatia bacterium]